MMIGEIIRMTSAKDMRRDDAGRFVASFTFKAPKTEDFIFLYLGTIGHSEDFKADAVICTLFRSLGWTVEPPKPQ